MFLEEKIKDFVFHPEVYVYPTPRTYKPLDNFSLDQVNFGEDINLYLHIPFCKQICSFCGYLKMIDSVDLRKKYVNSIRKEIEMYRNVLRNKRVKTLHFGGGTPSLLSFSDLERIFDSLLEINPNILNTAKEVSIEATPESIGYEKFSDFRTLGINRVSMGVQTLNDSEIALSRRHNLSSISLRAVETLRDIEIPNIVIDLMIGIEGQTVKSFEESVLGILQVKPETVELYALGLMPNTILNRNSNSRMSNKEIYQCYDLGRLLFLREGYKQDCHNRYAIPERGSFLQEDFVFRGTGLIGFGAGARSYAQNMHYRNSPHSSHPKKAIHKYMEAVESGKLPISTGVVISPEEKIRQFAVYNIESLDKKEFQEIFGIDFRQRFCQLYQELLKLDLACENDSFIKLTPKGLNFRDLIAYQLFSNEVKLVEEAYRPK